MAGLFENCSNLLDIDVSSFNTSNNADMSYMFTGCSNLTKLDLTNFDTSKVGKMGGMFMGCKNLRVLDLSNFDTSNVWMMCEEWQTNGMFQDCENLSTIYVGNGWNTNKVYFSNDMFLNCTSLVGGAGTVYDANHVDVSYAHIDGGASNPGYLTDKNASELPATISTVDDLQARLDAIAEKGVPSWRPDTVELSAGGVFVDKTLYVRNGCHAILTGGPLRVSPQIQDHYCIFVNKENSLHLNNLAIDLMGNDFHYTEGIFYDMGSLYVENVELENVPSVWTNAVGCLFYVTAGSVFTYNDGYLYSGYMRTIMAEKGAVIDIWRGEMESRGVPTIDGLGNVKLWYSTVSGGGDGVSIINAINFNTHEGDHNIIDREGGATYITADSIALYNGISVNNNFGGNGKNVVIGRHAYVEGDMPVPILFLKRNASITLCWGTLSENWVIDGDWSAFYLDSPVVKEVSTLADFERMKFINMPSDREAVYSEVENTVRLGFRSSEGIVDADAAEVAVSATYDAQGRRRPDTGNARGLRLQRMADGTIRKVMR